MIPRSVDEQAAVEDARGGVGGALPGLDSRAYWRANGWSWGAAAASVATTTSAVYIVAVLLPVDRCIAAVSEEPVARRRDGKRKEASRLGRMDGVRAS